MTEEEQKEWTSILVDDVGGSARISLLSPEGHVLKVKVFFAGEVLDLLNRLVEIVEDDEVLP